jgi:hypothetical protein
MYVLTSLPLLPQDGWSLRKRLAPPSPRPSPEQPLKRGRERSMRLRYKMPAYPPRTAVRRMTGKVVSRPSVEFSIWGL